MALKRIQKVSAGDRPGAAGRASAPTRTDPGGGLKPRTGRAQYGRVDRGGYPGRETRAGPAGTGQVRWDQGQVRVVEVLEGRGPAVLAPDLRSQPPWGDRFSSVSTSSRNLCFTVAAGLLPYTGLVLAPVILFSPRSFLARSLYVLASPGSRGGQGRCGGPAAFFLGAVGFVLSLLCGWLLLRYPNGLEKPI